MRDVVEDLDSWWRSDTPVGMATVVATWQSAPRPAGATMLVGPGGVTVGSVSGGCVEGAVHELATEVLASGQPVLRRYGISDGDAFSVGLTCGGTLDVYVERVDRGTYPQWDDVGSAIRTGTPVAVATCVADAAEEADRLGRRLIVWPDRTAGSLGTQRLDAAATDDVRGMLAAGETGVLRYGRQGQRRGDDLTVFVAVFGPRPRMIVCGAIDFAAALAHIGDFLGYQVTVCDARPTFATQRRFPTAEEVVVEWPHKYLAAEAAAGRLDERTVVCALTHDLKFDVPLLEVALRLPLAYVGAMGSRKTHDDRLARLREAGLTEKELARLFSPLGLDLGGRTPEETALSIAAEVTAVRWGGTGMRLGTMRGRIHGGEPATHQRVTV